MLVSGVLAAFYSLKLLLCHKKHDWRSDLPAACHSSLGWMFCGVQVWCCYM